MHLHPRLLEFLNIAAKQLVGDYLLEQKKPNYIVCDSWLRFPFQTTSQVKQAVSVANNACWAIGELAVKVSSSFHAVP